MSIPSSTYSSSSTSNQVKVLIPTLIYLAASTLHGAIAVESKPPASPHLVTMKVHPIPSKKRNITIQYDARINNSSSIGKKKLRRLPHIFSRVLELPFRSDAEVEVEENPGFFRFVAETEEGIGCDVRTHTIEIHPGVTKIVVRPNLGPLELLPLDQLEIDMWRFRLPESTRPELASAVCVDGELIVTVPKQDDYEDEEEEREDFDAWGLLDGGEEEEGGNGSNRLVTLYSKQMN